MSAEPPLPGKLVKNRRVMGDDGSWHLVSLPRPVIQSILERIVCTVYTIIWPVAGNFVYSVGLCDIVLDIWGRVETTAQ